MVMVVVGKKRLLLKSFIEIEHSPCTNLMGGGVIEIVVTKSGVAVAYGFSASRDDNYIDL